LDQLQKRIPEQVRVLEIIEAKGHFVKVRSKVLGTIGVTPSWVALRRCRHL